MCAHEVVVESAYEWVRYFGSQRWTAAHRRQRYGSHCSLSFHAFRPASPDRARSTLLDPAGSGLAGLSRLHKSFFYRMRLCTVLCTVHRAPVCPGSPRCLFTGVSMNQRHDNGSRRMMMVEPWLSSCRAVEAPSRHCRGAVEALSRRCRGLACRAPWSSLSSYCRVPVEPVEPDSMRLGVEVCRGLSSSCRVAVELSSNVELMNSCLAVEPGNAYAYSFA